MRLHRVLVLSLLVTGAPLGVSTAQGQLRADRAGAAAQGAILRGWTPVFGSSVRRLDHTWASGDSVAREGVRAANRRWRLGALLNDANLLGGLLADGWTITEASGVQTKDGYLGDVRSGERSYEFMDDVETSVVIWGETAVLTGHSTSKGYLKDRSVSSLSIYTRTFVLQQGRWQMVAAHSTLITR